MADEINFTILKETVEGLDTGGRGITCEVVEGIKPTECIGNSLETINTNFSMLDEALCSHTEGFVTIKEILQDMVATIDAQVPPGTIISYVSQILPFGWLLCNGDAVPNGEGTVQGVTADFTRLFNALGTSFGDEGVLPDLRGYFIRGFGKNSDGTESAAFGTKVEDSFKSHYHQYNDTTVNVYPSKGNGPDGWALQVGNNISINGTTAYTGGKETAPKHIPMSYLIKF